MLEASDSRGCFKAPPLSPPPSATAQQESCEFGSAKYYAICGFGGILSCGLTHTALVPLDLVKCRIQVSRAVCALNCECV